MKTNDYTELLIQSEDIHSALMGLQKVLFYFPHADQVKPTDITQINGVVAAITALAERNVEELAKYFEQ